MSTAVAPFITRSRPRPRPPPRRSSSGPSGWPSRPLRRDRTAASSGVMTIWISDPGEKSGYISAQAAEHIPPVAVSYAVSAASSVVYGGSGLLGRDGERVFRRERAVSDSSPGGSHPATENSAPPRCGESTDVDAVERGIGVYRVHAGDVHARPRACRRAARRRWPARLISPFSRRCRAAFPPARRAPRLRAPVRAAWEGASPPLEADERFTCAPARFSPPDTAEKTAVSSRWLYRVCSCCPEPYSLMPDTLRYFLPRRRFLYILFEELLLAGRQLRLLLGVKGRLHPWRDVHPAAGLRLEQRPDQQVREQEARAA